MKFLKRLFGGGAKTGVRKCAGCGKLMQSESGDILEGGWICRKCGEIFCGDCCEEPDEDPFSWREYVGIGVTQVLDLSGDGLKRMCPQCDRKLKIWKVQEATTENPYIDCPMCGKKCYKPKYSRGPIRCPYCGEVSCWRDTQSR